MSAEVEIEKSSEEAEYRRCCYVRCPTEEKKFRKNEAERLGLSRPRQRGWDSRDEGRECSPERGRVCSTVVTLRSCLLWLATCTA